jgi:phosphoribosylamine--glycine ligase
VDLFTERSLLVFGPTRAAAQLEASKVFAKALFARYRIPTARHAAFSDAAKAQAFARELGGRAVVKADGLTAGKGAVVCPDLETAGRAIDDMLERRVFGDAGARVVVEEVLEGEELSFFVLTDGDRVCPLGAAQDHKAVFDEDRGPNTGGMGAYSPAPVLDEALAAEIVERVIRPTVRAMATEGRPYRGVLYAGLMLTREGPKVLEFNARFGDPETQVLVTRLAGDLLTLCRAVAEGRDLPETVLWRPETAVSIVLASGGYPGAYATGHPITGVEAAGARPGVTVFHAGTALRDGRLVTSGGRVLAVTALGRDTRTAIAAAYDAVGDIRFEGMHFRRDIGRRALAHLGGGPIA